MNAPRLCTLFAAALVTLAATARATDIVVQNDSLAGTATAALQEGFGIGEIGGAVLNAPGQFPLTLKEIQVMVLKDPSFPQTTMTGRLYVWNTSAITQPSLASAIYTGTNITLQEGGFNIIDVSANNIVVTGPFTVGCMIVATGGVHIPGFELSSPSLVTDADGCQTGKSFVRETNGNWANLCSLGVSGDLAIRVKASTGAGGGTGQFINLGNGLVGNFAPTLIGSGSLAGGANFSLAFAGMPPGSAGPLFVGITQINAPFKGGTLVPNPLLIISLSTGFGAINLPGSIPLNVPSNFSFFLQAWFPDLGGPQKGDATNGLRMITP